MQQSLYSFTPSALDQILVDYGFKDLEKKAIKKYLYREQDETIFNEPYISQKRLQLLFENYTHRLPEFKNLKKADDGTVKYHTALNDNEVVESVIIPFYKKPTVCLSSQVGCLMGCTFCFTATMGLKRSLQTEEIIGQYLLAKKINNSPVNPNIVFMGQGEPLHNFDVVKNALEIMLDPTGMAVGPRQITLSTVGYVPGLKRLNELPPINIALSLHSAIPEKRAELMPMAKRYNINEVLDILDDRELLKKQFITYEYLLIKDFNDGIEDADALYELLKDRKAILNIIPFNPFPNSKYKRPLPEDIEKFKDYCVDRKLRTMVRTTKGDDIMAACGQLKPEKA